MKTKYLIFILFHIIFFTSCKKDNNDFSKFIQTRCNFNSCDRCKLDLKDFFMVDYDTMYVFGEYTQLQGISLILGIEYNETNIMMPKGFVVEDSYNKIILLKNHKIVYDEDVKSPYFYSDNGIIVEKSGAFDDSTFIHRAKMFLSTRITIMKDGSYFIE